MLQKTRSQFRTRTAFLTGAAGIAMAVPAAAQDAQTQIRTDSVSDAPAIIVTGTRQSDRSAADTVVPVDIVSAAELSNNADSDIGNVLRVSVPSFNVGTQPISDAATLVRPANLRGLSPDNTLVLVNGKRQHRAAVIAFLGGASRMVRRAPTSLSFRRSLSSSSKCCATVHPRNTARTPSRAC